MTNSTTETGVLVHWTYSREEWKNFSRWDKRRGGWLPFLWQLLKPLRSAPEVRITPDKVQVGGQHFYFRGEEQLLKRITIRDAGILNVLEITFMSFDHARPGLDEIRVPVPRGKLREAIELQDKLTQTA